MNENIPVCQSCGMPMTTPAQAGTEAGGTPSKDYCTYCYQNGAFTREQTMEEMIESCLPFISEGNPFPDKDSARAAMAGMLPALKRWKA